MCSRPPPFLQCSSQQVTQTPLHPSLHAISFVLGHWRGTGEGKYPTIQPFRYKEELRFWQEGKPVILYSQRTTSEDGLTPLHQEFGYIRVRPNNLLEMALCDPAGLAYVLEGTFDAESKIVQLKTRSIASSTSAKEVKEVTRELKFTGSNLRYTLSMAAMGHPLQEHLKAVLERVE